MVRSKTRSKYNVSLNTNKRTFDGIVFDSQKEMEYYRDVVLPRYKSGEIIEFELQKDFILQEGFVKEGRKIQPIKYKADFYLVYKNGSIQVIDIKGMADSLALLKRKMFWYHFPTLDYIWLSHCAKYGGWIEYDELKRLRKLEKKKKEKEND